MLVLERDTTKHISCASVFNDIDMVRKAAFHTVTLLAANSNLHDYNIIFKALELNYYHQELVSQVPVHNESWRSRRLC